MEQTGSEGTGQVCAIGCRSSPNLCSARSPSRPSRPALPPGSAVPGAPPCSSAAVCPSARTPTPRHCRTGCRTPRQGDWKRSMPSRACAPRQTAGAPGTWVTARGGGRGSLAWPCRGLVALCHTPYHCVRKSGRINCGFVVPVGNSTSRDVINHLPLFSLQSLPSIHPSPLRQRPPRTGSPRTWISALPVAPHAPPGPSARPW